MTTIRMKTMLECGVHFGHRSRFWHPKMAPYIYGIRNNIHIINLEKTLPLFNEALNFISQAVAESKNVLFVGTKRAATSIIKAEALRCGSPYVNHRWLGGMMTNYKTIKASIKRLRDLELLAEDNFEQMSKREGLMMQREMEKLEHSLGGIKELTNVPDVLFVIDIGYEKIAVKEAKKLGIPIVAVVDTNYNPDGIDYIIPGNDDSIRSISLYAREVANIILATKASLLTSEEEDTVEIVKKTSVDTSKPKETKPVAQQPAAEPKAETSAPKSKAKKPAATPEAKKSAADKKVKDSSVLDEGELKDIAYLFHMTHLDNLENILKHNLLTHNLAHNKHKKYNQEDISNEEVNEHRGKPESVYGKSLHDYVPLYFNPHNRMLLFLKTNRPKIYDKVIILGFDKNIMLEDKIVFTNKNAAKKSVEYEGDIEKLTGNSFITWSDVFNKDAATNNVGDIYSLSNKDNMYYKPCKNKDEGAKLMAETLIPNEIHKDKIKFICCQNDDIKQEVIAIMENYNTKTEVTSNCNYIFW